MVQSAQNFPVGTGGANGSQNFTKNATINYEVNNHPAHQGCAGNGAPSFGGDRGQSQEGPGKPKPIPLSAAELQQITDLAREAMGFTRERGDTLNVANVSLTVAEKEVVADTPFYRNQKLISILLELARSIARSPAPPSGCRTAC